MFDRTAALDILKELYPNGAPAELVYPKSKLLALLPAKEDFEGELYKIPLWYGDPQGRSATFATGRANMSPSKQTAFNLDVLNDYAFAQVSNDVIKRMKTNRGSFLTALKSQMDGAIRQLSRSQSHALFRNGAGVVARVGSVSTTSLVLLSAYDGYFIEAGQELVASANDGLSGSLRTGNATVTAVARSASTCTLTSDSNWGSQITSIAANDYLFIQGDWDAASLGLKARGLDAWITATDPTATTFYSVNRAVDPLRLGGVRVAGTSTMPIEEALQTLVNEVGWLGGGDPDLVIIHPKQYEKLKKSLGDRLAFMRGRRDSEHTDSTGATIGFETVRIAGENGPVDVLADANCQYDTAWCLQTDTWEVVSMGPLQDLIDTDGLPFLRTGTTDGVEIQLAGRWNLGCHAPGFNGRCTLEV